MTYMEDRYASFTAHPGKAVDALQALHVGTLDPSCLGRHAGSRGQLAHQHVQVALGLRQGEGHQAPMHADPADLHAPGKPLQRGDVRIIRLFELFVAPVRVASPPAAGSPRTVE